MLTEPEANNCFSIIFRGKYHELQNNGLKDENTDAIAKRASDVMTQTRLRQTNLEWWMILKISLRTKAGVPKTLVKQNFAYIPCISLRTRLC